MSSNKQHITNDIDVSEEKLSEKTFKSRRAFLKGLGLGGVAVAGGMSISTRAQLTDWKGGSATNVGNANTNTYPLTNKAYDNSDNNSRMYNQTDTDNFPHVNNNNVFTDGNIYNENWETPAVTCYSATIPTRLFSSSNATSSFERNSLALERLKCAGFNVENTEVMNRKHYRFGGTDNQRANDFEAIASGRVSAPKLMLGVRGGYGAMRILQKVNWSKLGSVLRERGTIVGGFSDVTAIQCALLAKGNMGSSNLPMAYSEFGKFNPDPISCSGFVRAVTEKNLTLYTHDSSRTSSSLPTILGQAKSRVNGIIWGGNLSVLSSLAGSAYLPKPSGGIVFIEEVGEQPYRIERMLYDMYLAGAFNGQQAIVFGAMARSGTDGYDPSYDVAAVIRELHQITGLPIYTGVGFGHVSKKQSFPMGCQCELVTTSSGFEMRFSGYPIIEASLINESALSMVI